MDFEANYHLYYAIMAFSLGSAARAAGYVFAEPLIFFKSKIFKFAGEIVACFIASAVFAIGKNIYDFPSLRAYMVVCFLLGFLLISKICDKKIAFFNDRLYNKLKLQAKKLLKKRAAKRFMRREKTIEKRNEKIAKNKINNLRKKNRRENRKIKKSSGFGNRGGGFTFGDFNLDNGLSIGRDKSQRKRNQRR